MRRIITLCGCFVLVAMLAAAPGAVRAQDPDAAEFEQLLAEATAGPSVFGPASGAIPHDAEKVIFEPAGVDLLDFAAHVEFTNPYAATADAGWDYGVEFRLTADGSHYRLYVTSREQWFLTRGADTTIDSGTLANLDTSATGTNTFDVVVSGADGYFAINDEFVSKLELAADDPSGDVAVATAFQVGNFQVGAETSYADFEVWELGAGAQPAHTPTAIAPTPVVEETPTAAETATATAAAPGTPVTPGDEPTYTSPTYGFSLSWDDTWTEQQNTSSDGLDYVRLYNGVSTLDIYGYQTDVDPAGCIDAQIESYRGGDGFANVELATDAAGQPLREDGPDVASAIVTFDFTPQGGTATAYTTYLECRPIVPGESMFLFVQFVPTDQFEAQTAVREEILSTLELPSDGPPVLPTETAEATATAVVTEEPTEGPTEEPTETTATAGGDRINVRLQAQGGADVSGLVTLSAQGDQTSVRILALGAEGTIALIHQGSCADLNPDPAFLLRDVDPSGVSQTTLNVPLEELFSGYAIALHADVSDLSQPVACGDIPRG